jgi:hypothetical protein
MLIAFLIAHLLGDFFFQSASWVKKKRIDYRFVLLHSVVYGVIFLVTGFFSNAILLGIVLGIVHWIIDSLKYLHEHNRVSPMTTKDRLVVFLADQSVHILCIVLVSYYVLSNPCAISHPFLNNEGILSWTLAILFVLKPANIIIKHVLAVYEPAESKKMKAEDSNHAGALIGSLERLLMVLLMGAGQYAAVGLVLTAKSIARYSKMTDDPEFAEYYLLGTLLSMLCALAVFLLVLHSYN